MSVSVDTSGWEASVTRLTEDVKTEIRAAFADEMDRIVEAIKRRAPKDQGALARSVRWEWGLEDSSAMSVESDDLVATVYVGDESTIVYNKSGGAFQNARLQERGTKNMPANPSINPVKRRRRGILRRKMAEALDRAISRNT